jgi:pimeloyl-ACP methyl ester carboxylesterase
MSDLVPLVLVHGAGANARVWDPLRRELSAFEVVTPDLPGRDGTPALERADEVARWLDARLERPSLVLGHSWGGAIALELALASERVLGVVLVSSGARLRVHPSILEAAEQAVRAGEPMSTRFAFTAGAPPEAIDAYEEAASTTPPAATLADWRGCDGFDRMSVLGEIRAPVLAVGGADDTLTPPKYQRFLAERVPRGELALVEGAGHMLPWEKGRALASAVRAWASAVG